MFEETFAPRARFTIACLSFLPVLEYQEQQSSCAAQVSCPGVWQPSRREEDSQEASRITSNWPNLNHFTLWGKSALYQILSYLTCGKALLAWRKAIFFVGIALMLMNQLRLSSKCSVLLLFFLRSRKRIFLKILHFNLLKHEVILHSQNRVAKIGLLFSNRTSRFLAKFLHRNNVICISCQNLMTFSLNRTVSVVFKSATLLNGIQECSFWADVCNINENTIETADLCMYSFFAS